MRLVLTCPRIGLRSLPMHKLTEFLSEIEIVVEGCRILEFDATKNEADACSDSNQNKETS